MIIKSGLWSIAGSAVEKLMLLATYVLVSRQVDKEQFGYLVIVFLIVEFLGYIASFGVGENILRRKEVTASFLASSHYFVIRIALLMVLLMILVAAPVAYFVYGSELFFLVLLMSIHPLFTCINSFYLALIQRDLRYKELAVRTAVVSFSSGLTGVFLALSGAGVVSMVAGRYVQAVADFFWLKRISRYRNDEIHSAEEVKAIARFGLPLSAAQVFNFGSSRFYEIFVTVFFGPAILAVLDVGRKFLTTFYRFVFTPLNSVVLTYLSSSQDKDRSYLNVVLLIQVSILPVLVFLGVLSEDVIELFFGSEWLESSVVLFAFSIVGVVQTSGWFLSQLIISKGESSLVFKIHLLGFFVSFLVMFFLYFLDFDHLFYMMAFSLYLSIFFKILYLGFLSKFNMTYLLFGVFFGGLIYLVLYFFLSMVISLFSDVLVVRFVVGATFLFCYYGALACVVYNKRLWRVL